MRWRLGRVRSVRSRRPAAQARPRPRAAAERGATTASYTVAVAIAMTTLVLCANVIVALYGRGVVRGALDEAVRAGAAHPHSVAACQQRAAEVLDQLLGGPMGHDITVACAEGADSVVAAAQVTFHGWLPALPPLSFRLGAEAIKTPQAASP